MIGKESKLEKSAIQMDKKNLKLIFEITTHPIRKWITCPQIHISAGGKKGKHKCKEQEGLCSPSSLSGSELHLMDADHQQWPLPKEAGRHQTSWGFGTQQGSQNRWTHFLAAFLLLLHNTEECSGGVIESLLNVHVGVADGHTCISGRAVCEFLLLCHGSGLLCLHTVVNGKTFVISKLRCCPDPCRGKIPVLPDH